MDITFLGFLIYIIVISIVIGIITYIILINESKRVKNMTLDKDDDVYFHISNKICGKVLSENNDENVKIEIIVPKHMLYKNEY